MGFPSEDTMALVVHDLQQIAFIGQIDVDELIAEGLLVQRTVRGSDEDSMSDMCRDKVVARRFLEEHLSPIDDPQSPLWDVYSRARTILG